MNVLLTGLVLASVGLTSIASAAVDTELALPAVQTAPLAEFYDAKASGEVIAKWTSGERKPASGASRFSETNLSDSFKKIRAGVLSAKSPEDIDKLLTQLETGYEALSDDAKYFAAQMLLIKPLRGIVWRMRPLFEQRDGRFNYFSGNPATHSAAVGMLRALYHSTKIYVPTQEADALFQYAVKPANSMTLSQQFQTVAAFQNFLATDMYHALKTASDRTSQVYRKGTTPYVLDAQTLYGKGTFDDGIARYVGFDDAEIATTLASLQGAMHTISVFVSYNQTQLMNVVGRIGKLYGVDGFSSDKLGVTSKERSAVLESFRKQDFLKLRESSKSPNYGRDNMKLAFTHLQAQVGYLKDAHDILQSAPATTSNVLNPLFFKPDAQPRLDLGVNTMTALVKGRQTVRSPVTGESVAIDLAAFYNNPPKQMLDLLPTSFQTVQTHEDTFKNDAGEMITYRNYSEGRPLGWGSEWKKLFPSLNGKQSVADAYRVIEYSTGPGMLFGPMSFFIL